jgi:hypothetical protein
MDMALFLVWNSKKERERVFVVGYYVTKLTALRLEILGIE